MAACLPTWAGSPAPNLEQALVHAGPDDLVPVVVLMEEFPDRAALLAEVRDMNREQRRAHVVAAMQGVAEQSQAPIHAALAVEQGGIREIRVLWGINGIALEAIPGVIDRLASLPGVRWVLHDREIPWQEAIDVDLERVLAENPPFPGLGEGPFPVHRGDGDGPTGGDTSGPNPSATVAGEVIDMGAQQVWDELGYTGAGVIVAVVDTGVDRTHPDLADHMWTNLDEVADNAIDDDGNGYIDDTWGWDFCGDDNNPASGSHGTQAAGQVAGDGTNGTVTGMAPDAEIMALGINCGGPSTWWAASDYAIANGAHMMTQSFSYKWPSDPDYEAFRRQTDTELAAGVIHVNSSGNTGLTSDPVPYNVATPGNCPPPWLHPDQTIVGGVSSVVGTANINYGTDDIDATSPYGPSAWEDIQANTDPSYPHVMPLDFQDYPYENGGQLGLLKPDLAAYGDGTISTCPGTGYCGFGGTSSATPHIAGVVALMLSSNIEASPAFIAEALMSSAEHRGVAGKNNRFGAGLVQAYGAVVAVESGVVYDSHVFDDVAGGNGDSILDPGEQVTMQVDIKNVLDAETVSGVEAILSTSTPGVTIHNHHVTFPSVPPGGTVTSDSPHFALSVDPGQCGTSVALDFELRFDGKVRRSVLNVRVGDEQIGDLLADDFESAGSWITDSGTESDGEWVREDPIGVVDGQGEPTNPEDDTSDPGVACYVTGNGEQNGRKDEDNNDVDGGAAILLSPPFGDPNLLTADLAYDRWYYDNSSGSDSFKAEVSSDGGQSWTLVEHLVNSSGGWGTQLVNLTAVLPLTDDMRVRFVVLDGVEDTAVEGAIDEVWVTGRWVACNDFTPGPALAPNPVGDTLQVNVDPAGHTVLTWVAPAADAGHDPATLYRIDRAESPSGPLTEVGSAVSTQWVDVDALGAVEPFYYRVRAENAGGSE
jgi:subtilisin family serine protease